MSVASNASGAGRSAARTQGGSALIRVAISAAVGILCACLVAIVGPWWLSPLSGYVIASLVFVGWTWSSLWSLDPDATAEKAKQENPGRALADALLLGASIVSLLAVGLVLVRAGHTTGLTKGLLVGLSVASVVLAWSVVHTVFTLRYANLYYTGRPGGVDFNEQESPDYIDFVYLALTIGMTFQVSDTDLKTKDIRRTAVRHALLSYMFGAIILATTVNLIAGLSK